MSLPEDFLTQLEQYGKLSRLEQDIFLQLFGKGRNRLQIAEDLSISSSKLNTCLTGIYKKFSIRSDLGRGKENHLRDYLTQRYSSWKGAKFYQTTPVQDINALVEQARQQIQPYIQYKCGVMQILDMNQPIGLNDIYTNVNILEKITGRRGLKVSELQNNDLDKFERCLLGDIIEKRVPGLQAVEKFSQLIILGKPGSGKTTFLKYLAIQSISGKFQVSKVPVFITLKDFAEANEQPTLLTYIEQCLTRASTGYFETNNYSLMQNILRVGRAIILLDGLDEVRDADNSRVLRQVEEFSQQFSQNQFVITCRIAAREHTFQQFTQVEIADFENTQIDDFSKKWFEGKNDFIKANRFVRELSEVPPIGELANNPLLLTLLCLVFEGSGKFPAKCTDLYNISVYLLLKKWDLKRNIERSQVYKRLSLERKEYLLCEIAYTNFNVDNYFFKQRELEYLISEYIKNLPDVCTDSQALELDAIAVLKSIEAQHGLLVERARGIYSFSHLTFHEYFTARHILISSATSNLIENITKVKWREVFFLVVEMLPNADDFFRKMKQYTDNLLANDLILQTLLVKAKFLRSNNLFSLNPKLRDSSLFSHSLGIRLAIQNLYIGNWGLSLLLKQLQKVIDLVLVISYIIDLMSDLLEPDSCLNLEILFYCCSCHQSSLEFDLQTAINISSDNLIFQIYDDINVKINIEELKEQLPSTDFETSNAEIYYQWWQEKAENWTKKIVSLINVVKNILLETSSRFSKLEEKISDYYYANNLLLSCLNRDCYVSKKLREKIEETLLLPISEIEKINVD